jgi:hypothetical protein
MEKETMCHGLIGFIEALINNTNATTEKIAPIP